MKKWLIWSGMLLLFLITAGLITVYSWSHTPYGILDYKAALGLRLLYEPPDFDNFTVEELRARYLEEEKTLPDDYKQWIETSRDTILSTAVGKIPVRIYIPNLNEKLPVIVYYHGGGFVFGTLNEYNTLCAKLAHFSSALVVSVDYRLAPENPYPAAVEDAYAALQWIYHNAYPIGGDSTRMAVMGSSAGGNLAAVVTQMARDRQELMILHQVLLYPATQSVNLATDSHLKYGRDFGLTTQHVAWYIDQYLPNKMDRYEAYASPLLAEDLSHLPPAFVALAGFDPLRSEGEDYAIRMQEAGVEVTLVNYPTMIHGFAKITAFHQSEEVLKEIGGVLKQTFLTQF
jgi:acetyl esterase